MLLLEAEDKGDVFSWSLYTMSINMFMFAWLIFKIYLYVPGVVTQINSRIFVKDLIKSRTVNDVIV